MADYEEDDELLEDEGSHKPFCPKCGSIDIRLSHSHKALDFLIRTFKLFPYRCRSCRKRFYKRRPETGSEIPMENEHVPKPSEANRKAEG